MPEASGREPAFADILEARRRLAPHAVLTPLISSPVLDERLGRRVFLKAECLQRTGSFKFRGAFNKISRLARADWPGGVVACSSGNHAQGVAEAARLCGLPALIVMPSDAPKLKLGRTRRSGAEIVLYDRVTEDRDAIAAELCRQRQAAFVPPFDDPLIMAGQGTAGLELMEQAGAACGGIEGVLVPASGGGLLAGTALAVKHTKPDCRVYCVEPAGFDDYGRSLRSGRREKNAAGSGSVCDALLIAQPGERTFPVNQRLVSGGFSVTDDEALAAVAFAFYELKLVVEPGGAVGLAALLAGRYPAGSGAVAVVLSGGNVDGDVFSRALAAYVN
jgi:threonine dehydratase